MMRTLKQFGLVAMLGLGLAACGGSKQEEPKAGENPCAASTEAQPEAAPEATTEPAAEPAAEGADASAAEPAAEENPEAGAAAAE